VQWKGKKKIATHTVFLLFVKKKEVGRVCLWGREHGEGKKVEGEKKKMDTPLLSAPRKGKGEGKGGREEMEEKVDTSTWAEMVEVLFLCVTEKQKSQKQGGWVWWLSDDKKKKRGKEKRGQGTEKKKKRKAN